MSVSTFDALWTIDNCHNYAKNTVMEKWVFDKKEEETLLHLAFNIQCMQYHLRHFYFCFVFIFILWCIVYHQFVFLHTISARSTFNGLKWILYFSCMAHSTARAFVDISYHLKHSKNCFELRPDRESCVPVSMKHTTFYIPLF